MSYRLVFVSLSAVIILLSGNQIISQANQDQALTNGPAVALTQSQIMGQETNNPYDEPAPVVQQAAKPSAADERLTPANDSDDVDGQPGWFIREGNSTWTDSELETVSQALTQTIRALSLAGLDGQEIFQGYRFRRFQGEYVDAVDGRLAIVDHQNGEIVLSDAAFKRHKGFNIYHELGHIVDYRLDRQLSHFFHLRAGTNQAAVDWATAEGYWLRNHGRYDREEATADAFALWVLAQDSDAYRPVFFGTPVTVDYEAIIWAIEDAF